MTLNLKQIKKLNKLPIEEYVTLYRDNLDLWERTQVEFYGYKKKVKEGLDSQNNVLYCLYRLRNTSLFKGQCLSLARGSTRTFR